MPATIKDGVGQTAVIIINRMSRRISSRHHFWKFQRKKKTKVNFCIKIIDKRGLGAYNEN